MPDLPRPLRVVVMGVAGCGKSEAGTRIASALGVPLVEGDAFHPAANVAKMRAGTPLGDDDRAGWLQVLGAQLAAHPSGVVLTCSALKRTYRDVLRASAPGLAFVHLRLSPAQARERVARRPGHFYPPALVDSQYAALEDPEGEARVVTVDASLPLDDVVPRALEGVVPLSRG